MKLAYTPLFDLTNRNCGRLTGRPVRASSEIRHRQPTRSLANAKLCLNRAFPGVSNGYKHLLPIEPYSKHLRPSASMKKLGHDFLHQEFVRLLRVRKDNEIGHPGLFDP